MEIHNDFQKKDWIVYIACVVFIVIVLLLSGGCATNKRTTNIGNIRDSYTYITGKLESSVENFDRNVRAAVDRSRGIEDGLEQLEYLFGQYEQAALRLRDENISLREQVEVLAQSSDYNNIDSGSDNRSSYTDIGSEDERHSSSGNRKHTNITEDE